MMKSFQKINNCRSVLALFILFCQGGGSSQITVQYFFVGEGREVEICTGAEFSGRQHGEMCVCVCLRVCVYLCLRVCVCVPA